MAATSLIDAELAWVRAPADPVHVLPAVIFGLLGKRELDREERAPCGMSVLQPLCPSPSADILSQLTDRVRRALVASAPWEGALEPSIRRQDPLSLLKTLKAKEILEFLWDLEF